MTTYAPELYRECERRTPAQSAAKTAKADTWRRYGEPLHTPVRQLGPSTYQGLKAR